MTEPEPTRSTTCCVSSPATDLVSRASVDDCALCVSFIECRDATQHYVAASGTLVIHDIELVGDPWISATLTGAHLVEWDLESGIPVLGGQTLCIDYWRFDEDFFGLL
jgi:hypothetical protein